MNTFILVVKYTFIKVLKLPCALEIDPAVATQKGPLDRFHKRSLSPGTERYEF